MLCYHVKPLNTKPPSVRVICWDHFSAGALLAQEVVVGVVLLRAGQRLRWGRVAHAHVLLLFAQQRRLHQPVDPQQIAIEECLKNYKIEIFTTKFNFSNGFFIFLHQICEMCKISRKSNC